MFVIYVLSVNWMVSSSVGVAVWEGVFGVASTRSFTSVGSVNYTTALANVFGAYRFGTFSARRAGNYYVEVCASAQVTWLIDCIHLLSTHADRHGVDISFTVCFFLFKFFVRCAYTNYLHTINLPISYLSIQQRHSGMTTAYVGLTRTNTPTSRRKMWPILKWHSAVEMVDPFIYYLFVYPVVTNEKNLHSQNTIQWAGRRNWVEKYKH